MSRFAEVRYAEKAGVHHSANALRQLCEMQRGVCFDLLSLSKLRVTPLNETLRTHPTWEHLKRTRVEQQGKPSREVFEV